MPRTGRASVGGYCYHVLSRGNPLVALTRRASAAARRGGASDIPVLAAFTAARSRMARPLAAGATLTPGGVTATRDRVEHHLGPQRLSHIALDLPHRVQDTADHPWPPGGNGSRSNLHS